MLFNSIQFLVFFPVVLGLYFYTPYRLRWMLLLAASLYFYMAWRPEYVVLLLGESMVAYWTGIRIQDALEKREKKLYLSVAVILLVGTLFVFKYFNFFNESFRGLFDAAGLSYAIPAIDLILPLGISFHTFQLLGYVIDVYYGKLAAERHVGYFALFGSYFPQLIAGPIERATNLLKQFHKNFDFDEQRVIAGLQLMAWGFFKKIVVADRLDQFVEQIYGKPQSFDGISLMIGTVFFAFQVYCDFSGYTDIAIGAAQTMGFTLMKNFERPYFAASIQDFWKRWHISLTTWLTDYVYKPLTRSQMIKLPWYYKFLLCLFVTFIVSGLWHGAAWTFVAWGALHGTFLVSSIVTQNLRKKIVGLSGLERVPRLHHAMRVLMTFTLVCFTYIFFRANNLGDAWYVVTHMLSGVNVFVADLMRHELKVDTLFADLKVEFMIGLAGIGTVIVVDLLQGVSGIRSRIAAQPAWARWSLYYAHTVAILVLGVFGEKHQFVYFQF